MTRRTLVGSLVATAAALQVKGARKEWKPKLGVLGPYTPANVAFARAQGYNNMIIDVGRSLNPEKTTDTEIESVKAALADAGMYVSAFELATNHISADPAAHQKEVAHFQKAIEMAGKLGVHHIGAMSGKNDHLPFAAQIDQIVRVYTEKYFPLCEKHQVRICWEPWPEGPNLATARSATMRCSAPSAIRRGWVCSSIPPTRFASSWTRSKSPKTTWTRSMTCI